MPYVDDAIYSDETKTVFTLLITLWLFFGNTSSLCCRNKERMEQHSASDANKDVRGTLGNQIHGATPLPSGKGGTMPKQAEEGKKNRK